MEAIRTYIDNVFAAFPITERVMALKREMLVSMEEKYIALKQEGKSEHEAVGGVIVDFGSIDEIAEELGIKKGAAAATAAEDAAAAPRDEALDFLTGATGSKRFGAMIGIGVLGTNKKAAAPEDAAAISRDEALAYLAGTKRYGIWIGIGVWLILAGVSVMLLINGFDGLVNGDWLGGASVFVLMCAVAGAVAIFIVNGMALSRYGQYKIKPISLDAQTSAEINAKHAAFMRRFTAQIAVGVTAILLAVGIMAFLLGISDSGNETLAPAAMIFIVGFALLLLINAGTMKSAYDVLLGKVDVSYAAAYAISNKKSEQIIATIASVYWPLVLAAYLLWSFLGKAWGTTWIIWPIAGILFGALSGGIGAWSATRQKEG
jgi:hypothetical protein